MAANGVVGDEAVESEVVSPVDGIVPTTVTEPQPTPANESSQASTLSWLLGQKVAADAPQAAEDNSDSSSQASVAKLKAALVEDSKLAGTADDATGAEEMRLRVEGLLDRARQSFVGQDFVTAKKLAEHAQKLVQAVNLPFQPEQDRPVDLLREIEALETPVGQAISRPNGSAAVGEWNPEAADPLAGPSLDLPAVLGTPKPGETVSPVALTDAKPVLAPDRTFSERPITFASNPPRLPEPVVESPQWDRGAFAEHRARAAANVAVALQPPALETPHWLGNDQKEDANLALRNLAEQPTKSLQQKRTNPPSGKEGIWGASLWISVLAFLGVSSGFLAWLWRRGVIQDAA